MPITMSPAAGIRLPACPSLSSPAPMATAISTLTSRAVRVPSLRTPAFSRMLLGGRLPIARKVASRGRKVFTGRPAFRASSGNYPDLDKLSYSYIQALREKGVSYRRYNISEYAINHCWCCYSMRDNACRYPCRDQIDDMPAFHEMVIASKAVIITSPINWNNMSARLKDFLDRLNCIQNLYLLKRPGLTEGKIVGIAVTGHEDGATKTAMDIFLYFQQMGYLLAPFGIAYRVHGAQFNTITDTEFLKSDPLVIQKIKGMTTNVVELIRLDNEGKLKGKLVPVCE